jgi:hypothetical protein
LLLIPAGEPENDAKPVLRYGSEAVNGDNTEERTIRQRRDLHFGVDQTKRIERARAADIITPVFIASLLLVYLSSSCPSSLPPARSAGDDIDLVPLIYLLSPRITVGTACRDNAVLIHSAGAKYNSRAANNASAP